MSKNNSGKGNGRKQWDVSEESEWESGLVMVKKCELAVGKPMISMDIVPFNKISALMEEMGSTEWLAYLVGRFNKAGDVVFITDIEVPLQEVTGSSVDVLSNTMPKDSVGTVHSHHGMGSFFSGTDAEFVCANHDVTIVTAKTGKWKQTLRSTLPCGALIAIEAELEVTYPDNNDYEKFLTESVAKIRKKVVPVAAAYGYQAYNQQGPNGWQQGKIWDPAKREWVWPSDKEGPKQIWVQGRGMVPVDELEAEGPAVNEALELYEGMW